MSKGKKQAMMMKKEVAPSTLKESSGAAWTKDSDLYINVHAKPGAKLTRITDITSDAVSIQLAAPPRDGEANRELAHAIGEWLSVKKSSVAIDKGHRSREKRIVVNGYTETADHAISLLMDIASN